MAASVWKGSISFGLVSVPIKLFAAARYSHISFHEVHRECGHRVQQQLYCPYDKRVVSRDEIVMGYEVDEDKMIIVDREELKKLQPASSSTMEILQFVKLSDVDPIFFETSYFSVPEEAGRRGYTLLLETMEEMKLAALAQVTIHQRERTVILRPYRGGLTLHTLYYPNGKDRAPCSGRGFDDRFETKYCKQGRPCKKSPRRICLAFAGKKKRMSGYTVKLNTCSGKSPGTHWLN
jgi:DNA end-binding protein Ku